MSNVASELWVWSHPLLYSACFTIQLIPESKYPAHSNKRNQVAWWTVADELEQAGCIKAKLDSGNFQLPQKELLN